MLLRCESHFCLTHLTLISPLNHFLMSKYVFACPVFLKCILRNNSVLKIFSSVRAGFNVHLILLNVNNTIVAFSFDLPKSLG